MATEQDLREKVATACRILAQHGLVKQSTGHVSCRVPGENYILVRGRPPMDRGLRFAEPDSIIRVDLDGKPVGNTGGVRRVSEIYLHTEIYRRRPDVDCVIHAHPPGVVLCTATDLQLRLISATHEPTMRRLMVLKGGIPVFTHTYTLHTREETMPMLEVMGDSDVCLLNAHGIVATGANIEKAVSTAISLEGFARLNYWASLRGTPLREIPKEDQAELTRRVREERLEDFHPAGGDADPETDRENQDWAYYKALLETGAPQVDVFPIGTRGL